MIELTLIGTVGYAIYCVAIWSCDPLKVAVGRVVKWARGSSEAERERLIDERDSLGDWELRRLLLDEDPAFLADLGIDLLTEPMITLPDGKLLPVSHLSGEVIELPPRAAYLGYNRADFPYWSPSHGKEDFPRRV